MFGTVQSNPLAAQCHMYYIPSSDSTNTYSIGDAVKSTNTSDSSNVWGTFGIPGVVKCTGANSELARGVVVGMFRNPYALDYPYVPQTKAQAYYVMVYDDPMGLFELQADSTAFNANWPGQNAQYTVTAAQSAPLNLSTTVLAGGTVGTTSTLPLKIVSVVQRPNVATSGSYMPLVVKFNSHELLAVGTTGV